MSSISHAIKKGLNRVGVDVRLTRNIERAARREWADKWCEYWRPFIAHRKIKTVLDIGANTGQFATLFHRLAPDVRIISLEPLPDCFAVLEKNLATIPGASAYPLAIGAENGKATIHRSDFTPCTSFLAKSDLLDAEFGEGAHIGNVEVEVVRLDDFTDRFDLEDELMIKMDVQGFELEVIKGGTKTFQRAALVATEVCFFPRLYQSQPLFDDIYRALRSMNYVYMGNPEQLAGVKDPRIAEADAVFEKVLGA